MIIITNSVKFTIIIFYSQLTAEQKSAKDAMIHFEVKDKDMFRTRFMAEAFLPFSEISDVDVTQSTDYLKQIHLKLSRPRNCGNF